MQLVAGFESSETELFFFAKAEDRPENAEADLQSLVQHYLDNPHRRLALSTGATLDQLPTILAVTSQVQTPDPLTTS